MRYLLPCLVLPSAALAGLLTGDEAALLPRLIDSACIDIHDSIGCETVAFLKSESEPDRADLVILTDHRADGGARPLVVVRDFAFNGAMWGMAPSIEQSETGSLQLLSEQTGIGRYPWMQTLTVAWRDGAFVVAGITYTTYDRMTASTVICDVNLRTGGYVLDWAIGGEDGETLDENRETGRGKPEHIPLESWTADHALPAVCAKALDRL